MNKRKVYINKMPAVNGRCTLLNVPLLRLLRSLLCQQQKQLSKPETRTKAANLLDNDIISNRTTDESKQVTSGNITLDRIYIEHRKELVGGDSAISMLCAEVKLLHATRTLMPEDGTTY